MGTITVVINEFLLSERIFCTHSYLLITANTITGIVINKLQYQLSSDISAVLRITAVSNTNTAIMLLLAETF